MKKKNFEFDFTKKLSQTKNTRKLDFFYWREKQKK